VGRYGDGALARRPLEFSMAVAETARDLMAFADRFSRP
jgi:hypothetical protein